MNITQIIAALEEKGEFSLAYEVTKISALKKSKKKSGRMQMDKPSSEAIQHAEMRLRNLYQKPQHMQNRMANLRTEKTTSPEKLNAWVYVLSQENWHDCAEYATQKLRGMGYEPYEGH